MYIIKWSCDDIYWYNFVIFLVGKKKNCHTFKMFHLKISFKNASVNGKIKHLQMEKLFSMHFFQPIVK